MNWEAISAISEAFGMIAVVASLVFVGREIRQNAVATRADTMSDVTRTLSELLIAVTADEKYAELWWKGMHDAESLEGIERWRFANGCSAMFRASSNAFYQWRIGTFDTKEWQSHERFIYAALSNAGTRVIWKERKAMLPQEFVAYIESEVLPKLGKKNDKS